MLRGAARNASKNNQLQLVMNYIPNKSATLATNSSQTPSRLSGNPVSGAQRTASPLSPLRGEGEEVAEVKGFRSRTWMTLAGFCLLLAFPALVRAADAVTNLYGLIPFYTTNRL